ncbi:MAG: transcriptional repressor LexA [Desulfobacterota bacterium]|nr:transcriptional repressor LexA [Thermodesulfobacteriota bacterium]
MELTERQREVLGFIQGFIRERGYPPSIREIGEYFHIYPRAVFDHLKALERKGYLRRQGSMSRGMELRIFQGERLRGREERPSVREIPILGRVAAGKPTLAVENVEGSIPLPTEWVEGTETFLLKVKGDSMSPFILPGDYVIVRSQPSAENGEVVVTLMGEEATVKRFFKREGRIELKPDNENWETIQVEEGSGEVRIVGKVIGVFRRI